MKKLLFIISLVSSVLFAGVGAQSAFAETYTLTVSDSATTSPLNIYNYPTDGTVYTAPVTTISYGGSTSPTGITLTSDMPTISYGGGTITKPQTGLINISTGVITNTTNIVVPVTLPTPTVTLTINDTGLAYVNYGGSTAVKWESYGMSSCALSPINQTGTQGEYVVQNITSNMVISISCEVAPGFANYQTSPSTVTIKVLPPTFDYLKNYLSQLQSTGGKKLNLASVTSAVDQAQKAYASGKIENAKAALLKSVSSLSKQTSLAPAVVSQYENAVNYLIKTLAVKVQIAADGCSVTATGPAGLFLDYGANYQMRKGYGAQTTIPASGTVTEPIYAEAGWTATGEVVGLDGLIYARDTKEVTADCPAPPVVYDPSVYNGYPEKWATPAPGTVVDDWGYYNLTAESYVAFKVANSGRTFPAGYGAASEWLAKATTSGYVVETPQAGDVAINTLDITFGGPIAWHVDSVDASGNYQMTSFSSTGNMTWSSGSVAGSSFIKYIRFPY